MKKRTKRCPEQIILADKCHPSHRCILNGRHPGKNHCTVATGWTVTGQSICLMQVPMEISWPNKTSR